MQYLYFYYTILNNNTLVTLLYKKYNLYIFIKIYYFVNKVKYINNFIYIINNLGEIDRCLKKVSEGVETFDDIWKKVMHTRDVIHITIIICIIFGD